MSLFPKKWSVPLRHYSLKVWSWKDLYLFIYLFIYLFFKRKKKNMFLKEVSSAHQGCIYFLTNTGKTVIL